MPTIFGLSMETTFIILAKHIIHSSETPVHNNHCYIVWDNFLGHWLAKVSENAIKILKHKTKMQNLATVKNHLYVDICVDKIGCASWKTHQCKCQDVGHEVMAISIYCCIVRRLEAKQLLCANRTSFKSLSSRCITTLGCLHWPVTCLLVITAIFQPAKKAPMPAFRKIYLQAKLRSQSRVGFVCFKMQHEPEACAKLHETGGLLSVHFLVSMGHELSSSGVDNCRLTLNP